MIGGIIIMQMQLNSKAILNGINKVGRFKSKEKTKPALQFILLNVNEDKLEFIASDNEVYYKHVELITEGITKTGSFLIPSKLEDALRKVSGTVSLTLEGTTLKFEANSIKASIPVAVYEDFPKEPTGEVGPAIQFSKEQLLDIVNQCGYASATSDTRPALKGLNMSGQNGEFQVVSTDSHRLVKKVRKQAIELPALTIPTKTLKSVLESLEDEIDFVIAPFGTQLIIKTEAQEIFIRLITSNYPDTSKLAVIGDDYVKVKVNSKELTDALETVMLFAEEKSKGRNVLLESIGSQIRISAKGENGEIEHFINAEGEEFTKTAMNAKYLITAVNAHKKSTTDLLFKKGKSEAPVFIMCDDETLIQLILPIRIKQ